MTSLLGPYSLLPRSILLLHRPDHIHAMRREKPRTQQREGCGRCSQVGRGIRSLRSLGSFSVRTSVLRIASRILIRRSMLRIDGSRRSRSYPHAELTSLSAIAQPLPPGSWSFLYDHSWSDLHDHRWRMIMTKDRSWVATIVRYHSCSSFLSSSRSM